MFDSSAGPRRACPCGDDEVAYTAVGQLLVDGGLAVAAVGGHRARIRPACMVIRSIAGANCGASGGLPNSTVWSITMPSWLSTT